MSTHIPPPRRPASEEALYRRLERLMFVLRAAFATGKPTEVFEQLEAGSFLAAGVTYADPAVEARGVADTRAAFYRLASPAIDASLSLEFVWSTTEVAETLTRSVVSATYSPSKDHPPPALIQPSSRPRSSSLRHVRRLADLARHACTISVG